MSRDKREVSHNDDRGTSVDSDTTTVATNLAVPITDLAVSTGGFSAKIASVIGGNEHLVPRDHTVLHTMAKVQLSVPPSSKNIPHPTLRSTTPDVQPLLLGFTHIQTLNTVATSIQPSPILDATTQYLCPTSSWVNLEYAPVVKSKLSTATKHTIELLAATTHLASSDVQPSIWELVLHSIFHDVRQLSIILHGKLDDKHHLFFFLGVVVV